MRAVPVAAHADLDEQWHLEFGHASYRVQVPYCATVGTMPFAMLAQGLSDAFTPEVREAWAAICGVVAGTRQKAAANARMVQV
jgi:hemoglobin-like flavoprotein